MAIAFVAAADLGNNSGSTNSLTASYTVGSGSNRLLVVQVLGDVAAGADDITGVTYNGVSMTLAAKQVATGDRNEYQYYLIGPASGANNVVVSCTGTHYLLVGAADYTGVSATGQPDVVNHNSGADPTSISITTVTDNDWAVLTTGRGSGATNLTQRAVDGTFGVWKLFDTNGVITPAGSFSSSVSDAGFTLNNVLAGYAPAGAAASFTYFPLVQPDSEALILRRPVMVGY